MSINDNSKNTYYFGEISKVEIKNEELLDVFAYSYAPGPGVGGIKIGIFAPTTPVMVAPGPVSVFAPPSPGVFSPGFSY